MAAFHRQSPWWDLSGVRETQSDLVHALGGGTEEKWPPNCKYAVYFVSVCCHLCSKPLNPKYSANTWSWVEGEVPSSAEVTRWLVSDDAGCRPVSSVPGWGMPGLAICQAHRFLWGCIACLHLLFPLPLKAKTVFCGVALGQTGATLLVWTAGKRQKKMIQFIGVFLTSHLHSIKQTVSRRHRGSCQRNLYRTAWPLQGKSQN